MRTRVKICGLTRPEDVDAAVGAGADALGFMFHPESPRRLTVEQAAALVRRVPPFVARVGVFGDPTEALVREVVAVCGIDTLQFHGDETPEFCARFAPLPVYKAFRVRDRSVLETLVRYETAGWLLDSYVPGRSGGTGAVFNWALAIEVGRLGRPLILAGGLTPENVGEAVRQVRPYAVDVSSGVESSPGCKDAGRMGAFMAAVWEAG